MVVHKRISAFYAACGRDLGYHLESGEDNKVTCSACLKVMKEIKEQNK